MYPMHVPEDVDNMIGGECDMSPKVVNKGESPQVSVTYPMQVLEIKQSIVSEDADDMGERMYNDVCPIPQQTMLLLNSGASIQVLPFAVRVFRMEQPNVSEDIDNMIEEKYDLSPKVLGSGAFSQVLLCKSRCSGASMALKVVDKEEFSQFRESKQTGLTIDSERKIMEKIEHPNVVRLIETFNTESSLYLVIELLSGGDLLQRILDLGIYSTVVTMRLFLEMLNGINCLHELGIVHRDIKPDNILLTSTDEFGTAKIADMGLARYFGDPVNMKIRGATVCGTPIYFAPEMAMAAKGGLSFYGKAVDMWAAGVVLYIMLCGYPPFGGEDLYEQIASGDYDLEGEQWQDISPSVCNLVKNLMHVNADERLTTCAAISDAWLIGNLQTHV